MKLILSFILIICASYAKADYGYLKLSNLVCRADFAAVGNIVDLDDNYFYLKVEQYLIGELKFDTLKIFKFENWPCGRRYGAYELGQKELVFFRKSNYVIEDFELLGYGAGGEFELPIIKDTIYYNYAYGKLRPYEFSEFIYALEDFNLLKIRISESGAPISEHEQEKFSEMSKLHKLFVDCNQPEMKSENSVPESGYLVNLEKSYLYENYDNKVYAFNFDIDSINLTVEDAEVHKQNDYFVVNPKEAWTRRWLNVYGANDNGKGKLLHNQLFEIIELPVPRLNFGGFFSDTIYRFTEAIPSVSHFLDHLHEDQHLEYELLSYTYTIRSGASEESFFIKNARGTLELRDRLRKLKNNDVITVNDIYVLYPNNRVKQMNGRSVIFKKAN